MTHRFLAAAIHLVVSLMIIGGLYILIREVVFPGAIAELMQIIDGVKIVFLVDLILGPCLTLVVFNRNKANTELRRDLAIIALLQVAGLMYGLQMLHQSRPAVIAYSPAEESFSIYTLSDLREGQAKPELIQQIPAFKPLFTVLTTGKGHDDDVQLAVTLRMQAIFGEPSEYMHLLQPFPQQLNEKIALLTRYRDDIDKQQSCYIRTIQVGFYSGTACFNPSQLRFSDFHLPN